MENIPVPLSILIYIFFIWTIIWKGLALWRAASQSQRNWFIVILVLNTFSILEIVYLFRFSKKRMTIKEIKTWFQNTFFTKTKSK